VTINNPAHARRVLAYVETELETACLDWLRGVTASKRRGICDRVSAAEIRHALLSPGYSPLPSSMAWLRRQTKLAFPEGRWARYALGRLVP
jgi:hypothetical protein